VLSAGQATREVVQAMGFDVRVLGNHDFAWSIDELLAFSHDEHAIVLASNTSYDGPHPERWGAVVYGERQIGCLTVGFFGMVGAPWTECNEQAAGDFYPGGDFHTRADHEAIARRIVAEHGEGVDLMVMVSHLGVDADVALAAAVEGIDVVLGGHSHTPLTTADNPSPALVIQAGSYGGWIAHLDVSVDLASRQIVSHRYELLVNHADNPALPVDAAVQARVEQIMATHAPQAHTVVAQLAGNHGDPEIAALTARAALAVLPGADAALIDPATVFHTWGPGPLTQQDLLDAFKVERQPAGTPGWNALYLAQVSGAELRVMLFQRPAGWGYAGVAEPDPGGTYTLALQKCAAWNPGRYFAGVTLAAPRFASETWAVLDAYGRQRTAACLHLDTDAALPACP
jgi:5'-nucleotidase / UDP-sugar diphosphatase